jgi:hypothetical protein
MSFCNFQKHKAGDETYVTEALQIIQLLGKLHGLGGE